MRSISEILAASKTIAVVGLSGKRFRPSYGVSEYMQSVGYRIIPVNPNAERVLGEDSYPSLDEVREKIDIVNVFRRAEFVPEIADAAIRIGAGCLWLQEDIVDEESAAKARKAGLDVVMDRCILKEHRSLR